MVEAGEALQRWLLGQRWFDGVLLPLMPRRLRWLLRRVYSAPIDAADRLAGRSNSGVPPRAAVFTGAAHDFASSGDLTIDALENIAGLTPTSHVLDLGSGIGRFAIAMAPYLDEAGAYDGLDIVPEGVEWCSENIVGEFANVRFTLADVYNGEYNPKGRIQPADYRLPYENESFDVAVLLSVFTHMLPDGVDRYLSEIARVLKRDGRIVATYCIINDDSRQMMSNTRSSRKFTRDRGTYWTGIGKVRELAVAYPERAITESLTRNGFVDPPTIYFGGWCGRTRHGESEATLGAVRRLAEYAPDGGQDWVVAVKR